MQAKAAAMDLVVDHEDRAISEWKKFEKVEGLLKVCNDYMSCYQQLKDADELVVIGTSGEKAPRHGVSHETEWTSLSEEEKIQKIYDTAEVVNGGDFVDLCKGLTEFSEKEVTSGPLKKQARVIEKRDFDYNGDVRRVVDIVRCSSLVSSLSLTKDIVEGFQPGGRWATKWALVRCKDGFEHVDNFLAGGYRDIKVNVRHVETGHVVEIQLHLNSFYQIKNHGGHEYYTFARTLKVDGITNAVSVLSGLSNSLNWKIAEVGEKELDAAGEEPSLRYPIERRLGELYASMWEHGKYAIIKYDAARQHCEITSGKNSVEYFKILMELVYCVSEMQRHSDRENMVSESEEWMVMDLIPMIDEAIDGLNQLLTERHPFAIKALRIKADVYDSTMGRIDEAKALYYRVLDLQKETLGISHPDTIETLNNFGDLLTEMGEETLLEGFECYQTGLNGALKRMYHNHPTIRMLVGNMTDTLEDDGWGGTWTNWNRGAKLIPDGDKRMKELEEIQKYFH